MYELFQYIDKDSPVHRLDPRTKIISVLVFSVIILHGQIISLILINAALLAVPLMARISFKSLLLSLRPAMPFLVLLFVLYVFFTPGDPIMGSSFFISRQGLILGFTQIGKFILLLLIASILIFTTSSSEMTAGFERLVRPLSITSISSHDLAMVLSLALRFIPLLLREKDARQDAQLARGLDLSKGGLAARIRALTFLTGTMIMNVFRRCDELVLALEARGYQNGPRTYLRELCFGPADYIVLFFIVVWIITDLLW